jgi:hypothetical protein
MPECRCASCPFVAYQPPSRRQSQRTTLPTPVQKSDQRPHVLRVRKNFSVLWFRRDYVVAGGARTGRAASPAAASGIRPPASRERESCTVERNEAAGRTTACHGDERFDDFRENCVPSRALTIVARASDCCSFAQTNSWLRHRDGPKAAVSSAPTDDSGAPRLSATTSRRRVIRVSAFTFYTL